MPDLSRRNTLVPPPTLDEIEKDIENIDEDEEYDEGMMTIFLICILSCKLLR